MQFLANDSKSRNGAASMVGLVVVAVVGVTTLILTQTIIQEQRNEARRLQMLQVRQLASDVERLVEQDGLRDFSLTISKDKLGSISDLQIECKTAEDNGQSFAEITVQTADTELPEPLPAALQYSIQKTVVLP